MNKEINNNPEIRLPFFELDYSKLNGIVPVSILDAKTGLYLMTGYMTKDTYQETVVTEKVVFWSRSRSERWLKGETSGNFLIPKQIKKGCEDDILAIFAEPVGPVCHRGTWTCFDDKTQIGLTREQRFNEKGKCPYCGR